MYLDEYNHQPMPQENIADFINGFFTSIGPKLARKDPENYIFDGNSIPRTFEFSEIAQDEVIGLAKSINISKSSAIEGLSSRVLKDVILALPAQFTYLYNLTIQTQKFPDHCNPYPQRRKCKEF